MKEWGGRGQKKRLREKLPCPSGLTVALSSVHRHSLPHTPHSLTPTPSHTLHPRSAAVDPPLYSDPTTAPLRKSTVGSTAKSTVEVYSGSTVKVYSQTPPPQPASTHSPPLSLSSPCSHMSTCAAQRAALPLPLWVDVCVCVDGWMDGRVSRRDPSVTPPRCQ